MLATVFTAALSGIDSYPVRVEVSMTKGLPSFSIVGLPQGAVRESRDRVIAALRHRGYALPPSRITVNLSPAGVRKAGAQVDYKEDLMGGGFAIKNPNATSTCGCGQSFS